jgi:hypothetical protein
MQIIKLFQGDAEVAPLRLCDHLALKYDDPISVPGEETLSLQNVKCPNCGTWMCARCQDDAVRCDGGVCVGRICAECQATARKRDNREVCSCPYPDFWEGHRHCRNCGKPRRGESDAYDYLCAPCCARQDEAAQKLHEAMRIPASQLLYPEKFWLDEILEALDSATGKARDALWVGILLIARNKSTDGTKALVCLGVASCAGFERLTCATSKMGSAYTIGMRGSLV